MIKEWFNKEQEPKPAPNPQVTCVCKFSICSKCGGIFRKDMLEEIHTVDMDLKHAKIGFELDGTDGNWIWIHYYNRVNPNIRQTKRLMCESCLDEKFKNLSTLQKEPKP